MKAKLNAHFTALSGCLTLFSVQPGLKTRAFSPCWLFTDMV